MNWVRSGSPANLRVSGDYYADSRRSDGYADSTFGEHAEASGEDSTTDEHAEVSDEDAETLVVHYEKVLLVSRRDQLLVSPRAGPREE